MRNEINKILKQCYGEESNIAWNSLRSYRTVFEQGNGQVAGQQGQMLTRLRVFRSTSAIEAANKKESKGRG